ncbi:MAG: MerR family transcriptional regulator [Alistipes sp.]|nr:MerR family transcriptional regulator [Alistipes sp.]
MSPTKPTKSYYRIREVADMLSISTSTLRFWESKFEELKPMRPLPRVRVYTIADIEVIKTIQNLLHVKGLKVEAAKKQLRLIKRPNRKPVCRDNEDILKLLQEVKTMLADNPRGGVIIEAIEKRIKAKIKAAQQKE